MLDVARYFVQGGYRYLWSSKLQNGSREFTYCRKWCFSSDEHIALRNYVRSGGILFTIRLKDPDLFTLFGITNYDTKTNRRKVHFNMLNADADLIWFDDSLEQTISLGDTSAANVIETLGLLVRFCYKPRLLWGQQSLSFQKTITELDMHTILESVLKKLFFAIR